MIEEIIGKLKSEVGGELSSQTNIPADKMDGLFSVIGNVVKKEATHQMIKGNQSSLTNLFSDKPNNRKANKVQSKMHTDIIGELSSKIGLSPSQSKQITETVLPILLNMISKKKNTKADKDSSFLNDIFGSIDKKGLGGLLKGLFGSFMKK